STPGGSYLNVINPSDINQTWLILGRFQHLFHLYFPSLFGEKRHIMTLLLALDDTDSLESRGTGRLARAVADAIVEHYPVWGVTRHQLFVHPSIPFTSHNSCAVIHVDADGCEPLDTCLSIAEE